VRTRALVLLAAVLAAEAACLPEPAVPVRVNMPGVSAFPAGLFREIIVANFREDEPSPELALGRELQSYLTAELDRSFDGPVSRVTVLWEDGASLDDPGFWKQLAADKERAVVLAGTVGLSGQVRKALHKKMVPLDGPFKFDDRGFLEYLHYTLSIDLVVLSSETGESLFHKSFREEKDYTDIEKPGEFAFSELADRFRARLFPLFLGTSTPEERILLRR